MSISSESGLSLMHRLSVRPVLLNLLGDSVSSLEGMLTPVFYAGRLGDSSVVEVFLTDLICRTSLPASFREVQLGGSGASVLLLNCDHHVKIERVAEELQRRVKAVSEAHYRSLPKERRGERLTSLDQWQIVKRSLERVLIMEIFSPAKFEVSLVALKNILTGNGNISLVLINSINTFYHQVRAKTGIYHHAYLRRLLTYLVEALENMNENLRVLYVHLNLFHQEENRFYQFKNPADKLRAIKAGIFLGKPSAEGRYCLKYKNTEIIKNIF